MGAFQPTRSWGACDAGKLWQHSLILIHVILLLWPILIYFFSAIILYDVTNKESFDHVPIFVAGTKCDSEIARAVSYLEGKVRLQPGYCVYF
jgi:hypothetical protein